MHRDCGKSLIAGQLGLELLEGRQLAPTLHLANIFQLLGHVRFDSSDHTLETREVADCI